MGSILDIRLIAFLSLFAMASQAVAGGEGWSDNYAEAKTTAATEGKDMILDFRIRKVKD